MGIKSIRIKNVLSFQDFYLKDISEITCILGRNNTGKSNLLKLLNYFYKKMDGIRALSPELFSNYDSHGTITLEFDTSHINKLVSSFRNNKNAYFNHIYTILFGQDDSISNLFFPFILGAEEKNNLLSLTLKINNDGSSRWSIEDKNVLKIIGDLFPFFEVDTRHLRLHDWENIWPLLGKLRPFNANKFKDEVDIFLKDSKNQDVQKYNQNISRINSASDTTHYDYREKVVNFLKMGLRGQKFEAEGESLDMVSDGTNSYNYIETVFKFLIHLSRDSYILPTVFVDEPELGLHPKKAESLINNLSKTLLERFYDKSGIESSAPKPQFMISTHSPNIVKQVIKKFQGRHDVFQFSKTNGFPTTVNIMNSNYTNKSFLGIFSDNEARLFFSSFILFVEGETELEAFSNEKLIDRFRFLDNVDIYQTSSNVVSERINPGYSNTSIPYLFLFDADKAFDIAYPKTGSIINFKKNGNLFNLKALGLKNKEKKYYQRGYSTDHKKKTSTVNSLISFKDAPVDVCRQSLLPVKPKSFIPLVNSINQILSEQNFYILRTTFEGCLINYRARNIFYKWLQFQYKIDTDIIIARLTKSTQLTEQMLIQYFRVIFNGKSDTLIKYNNFTSKKDTVNWKAKKLMKILESNSVKNVHLDKTDGWVTQFINFLIDEISTEVKTKKEKQFNELFQFYFSEFYDTLMKLRSVA
jgi:predicted ATP-dependent endonuclease of OLD family